MDPLLVSRAEAGQKLINFLLRRLETTPAEVQRWLRTGQVRRNASRAKAFERVGEGDSIRIPPFAVPRQGKPDTPAHVFFPSIIYEDDDLLVLNKPAGLSVQGGTGQKESLTTLLEARFGGAPFMPAPAHRLDKDTSGLILVGKSYEALRRFTDALAGRSIGKITKEYLAWVWGDWPHEGSAEMRDYMQKDPDAGAVHVLEAKTDAAREAISFVRSLRSIQLKESRATLLHIRLCTGRTHQIRVQCASRGFPLVGDKKYGNPQLDALHRKPGLKLHACHIRLQDMGTETLDFRVEPPWASPWVAQMPEKGSWGSAANASGWKDDG